MSDPDLTDLDGVGEKRAELLRRRGYATVESVVDATLDDLVEIDGIGPATATDLLASAVRLLDTSEPTAETPRVSRVGTTFPRFEPVTTFPKPRIPFARPTRTPPTVESGSDRKPADYDASRPPDDIISRPPDDERRRGERRRRAGSEAAVGDAGTTLELAGHLLGREADRRGRVGHTPIDPSAVDVNVTVRFAPASRFDVDAAATLAEAGVPAAALKALPKFEDRVLERLEEDPSFAADVVASPDLVSEALDDGDPLSDLFASSAGSPRRRRDVGLAPVGLASLRVGTADGPGGE
ncbi:helix-hairpin-helix domain-containing protein [Halorubrum aethiopicum]|uniref:helix-hairpin-helix domain-containing protein n=1 Tax=Halorubrum aethiopicum TaxID=1758255 RepID=UPI001E43A56B|nr:helix-hairpin-helix domain-containing protein [Halorubrum aethiopicum]